MTTVLKGGMLIEGTGASPIHDAMLVMENDKIRLVGETGKATFDQTATVIDTSGKTILPGLFNCHAHLGWDGKEDIRLQSMYDSTAIGTFKVAMNMRRSLEAGVTTVRDLGVHKLNLYAKEAVDKGIVLSPRLIVSGQAIAMTGGHTWWCCREADGVDGVRQAVREQIKDGADVIKVMGCGAEVEFTEEELKAMVDEAHRAKKKITAHATFGECIKRVVNAGFDSVEHGGTMDDEAIQRMVEQKMYIVTTFSPVTLQARHGEEFGLPLAFVERRKRQMNDKSRYESIRKASEAGVTICMGTDAGSPLVPHNEVATELQLLIEYGICKDALEAITCATGNSAMLCDVEEKWGTLKEGLLADIVIVDGDPLDDLEHLRNVETVFLGGQRVFG
jgi:imidazolonepropionase-like amidohydrolase